MQAGWEQGISNVMAGLAGLNMVYEAAGCMPRSWGFAMESLILGRRSDRPGPALRARHRRDRGQRQRSKRCSRCVSAGPGHYLGIRPDPGLMQTEYVYPAVADRTSPKEWAEIGKPDLVQKAIARKNRILEQSAAPLFDPATDAALRAAFNIYI
jgi:trimethylamine--corrinoid protein Co-methyltransferase